MEQEHSEQDESFSWKEQEYADPYNLSEIPQEFYDDPENQNRVFMSDKEELGYLRNVVAAFFNYRVAAVQPE